MSEEFIKNLLYNLEQLKIKIYLEYISSSGSLEYINLIRIDKYKFAELCNVESMFIYLISIFRNLFICPIDNIPFDKIHTNLSSIDKYVKELDDSDYIKLYNELDECINYLSKK